MASSPYIVTKGVVLRETETRDADKILTLLTAERGKLSVIARGARRKGCKFAACAQPLAYSEWTLYKKGDWYYANEGATLELFNGLRADLDAMALGFYLAELTEAVTTEDAPHQGLLSHLLNGLYAVSVLRKPLPLVKAAFEIKTACDEISRKLLRWHWEQKPGAHSLDALLKHLAQRQKESPDYYDRMPDLSGKTSWQQLDTTLCMRVLLDPEKDAAKPLDLLGNTPHPSAARRACNAVRTARNEAAHAADRTDGTQAAILFNEAIESLEEGYAGTAFKTSELEQYYRMAEDFLSRCGAKKPLASAKAEEEEPRASTRNRNGTKPRSQSRGSGSSRSGNARRTNSGRSAGRGNGSRSRGSGRKKQRRVHYSRKMAVVLVAAVVLGLVVRAVSMGLFAK